MTTGSHVVVFTRDADADRAFSRDLLEVPAVDAGGGWLIFALPPAEVAFHPADEHYHELYLICDDLQATMERLEEHGIDCDEPSEESWGTATKIHLPGGGRIGLYQPAHPLAISPNS